VEGFDDGRRAGGLRAHEPRDVIGPADRCERTKAPVEAEKECPVAERRHGDVRDRPAPLGGHLECAGRGAGEEGGLPGVTRVPRVTPCHRGQAGLCHVPTAPVDVHGGRTGTLDGLALCGRGVGRDEYLGVYPGAGGVGRDSVAGVAGGILDDPLDPEFGRERERHRRAAVLERPGRKERVELEPRVPGRCVDKWRPPLAEGHLPPDRQEAPERPQPAVALERVRVRRAAVDGTVAPFPGPRRPGEVQRVPAVTPPGGVGGEGVLAPAVATLVHTRSSTA